MTSVTHLVTGLNPHGTEIFVSRLLPKLSEAGIHNRVISLSGPGPVGDVLEAAGIEVTCVHLSAANPNPVAFMRLARLLRKTAPDVLQTWLYQADFVGALLKKLIPSMRLAWNIRCAEMDDRYRLGLRKVMIQLLARMSGLPDAVVVNSFAGQRTHAERGYAPAQWHVIPNGVDPARFRPDPNARLALRSFLGTDPGDIVVGMVARLDPVKDHKTLVEAARVLVDIDPRFQFVLVGRGIEAKGTALDRMISASGISDHFHCLGERDDIERITAGLDISVLTSKSEGFPNVLCEAMASGVPCIATDAGDAGRIVGDTGFVVPPGRPTDLADAFVRLTRNGREEIERRGEEARERILGWSFETAIASYEALYRDMKKPKG